MKDKKELNIPEKDIENNLMNDNLNDEFNNVNHEINSHISFYLLHLISQNKIKKNYKELLKKQKKNIFNSIKIPKLSLGDFLYRITYYTKVSGETLISSLILISRYCKNLNIILSVYNIHRLLFISIMVNIKFMEDKIFSNTFYSTICGVKLADLNEMEYEFLCGIHFEMYIHSQIFNKYQNLIFGNNK